MNRIKKKNKKKLNQHNVTYKKFKIKKKKRERENVVDSYGVNDSNHI